MGFVACFPNPGNKRVTLYDESASQDLVIQLHDLLSFGHLISFFILFFGLQLRGRCGVIFLPSSDIGNFNDQTSVVHEPARAESSPRLKPARRMAPLDSRLEPSPDLDSSHQETTKNREEA